MAKPLLLFVHGAGKYGPNWSDKHLTRLAEIAATYPGIAQGGALEDQMTIVSVNYDTVFRDLLDRWRTQDDQLTELLTESGLSLPGTLQFLNDNTIPPEERGFFWTHVLDPILYRGFPTLTKQVQVSAMLQVVTAMNNHLAANPGAQISIMGQSLGTIVNHDILELLGTGQTTAHGDVWKSDRFSFANVFQVANASRLGPPGLAKPDAYESVVRPSTAPPTAGGLPGYCFQMFCFRNRWDPVPNFQRFDPQGWGPDYHDVVVDHVHQANVHGFMHYLENPKVHVELFRAVLGHWTVPDSDFQAHLGAFQNIDIPCGNEIADLKNALDGVITATDGRDFDGIINATLEFYRATKTARDACSSLASAVDGLF